MNRDLAALALAGLLPLLGCSAGARSDSAGKAPAQPSSPATKPSQTNPRRLNYQLPPDIPKLEDCRLRLELVHLRGQQIVWQTDRSPADIQQTVERDLTGSSWTISDQRTIEGGVAIVGKKGQRKCTFIIGKEPDQPTTIILLLNFAKLE